MTAYTQREIEACRSIADERGLPTYEVEWWYGADGVPVPLLTLEDAISEMEKREYDVEFIGRDEIGQMYCLTRRNEKHAAQAEGKTHREAAILALLQIVKEEA